jgi:hypothetical protein
VAITESGSGPMKALIRLWERRCQNLFVFLRVRIPKPVAAIINDDLAIATAAVLPCQIQAATPVRPYAVPPWKEGPADTSCTSLSLQYQQRPDRLTYNVCVWFCGGLGSTFFAKSAITLPENCSSILFQAVHDLPTGPG